MNYYRRFKIEYLSCDRQNPHWVDRSEIAEVLATDVEKMGGPWMAEAKIAQDHFKPMEDGVRVTEVGIRDVKSTEVRPPMLGVAMVVEMRRSWKAV